MSLAGRDGQPSGRSAGSSRLAAAEPLTSGLVNRRYARQSVRRPSSVRSASACIPAFCFVGWLLPAFHRPSGAVDAQAGTRAFLNIPNLLASRSPLLVLDSQPAAHSVALQAILCRLGRAPKNSPPRPRQGSVSLLQPIHRGWSVQPPWPLCLELLLRVEPL